MKKLFIFLVLAVASCFSQSGLISTISATGHGQLASINLPAVPVNGCVRYSVDFELAGGGFTSTLEVQLNSGSVQSVSNSASGDHIVLKGTICNDGSQSAQWGAYDVVTLDGAPIAASNTSSFAEDFSLPSNVLMISATVQRGFGVVVHGTVEILQP